MFEFDKNLIQYLEDERFRNKNYYLSLEDLAGSSKNFFILYLDQKIRNGCINTVDTGICDLTWKHEDCRVLMEILFELTQDDKYKSSIWYDGDFNE
jgi:hypothetical protein